MPAQKFTFHRRSQKNCQPLLPFVRENIQKWFRWWVSGRVGWELVSNGCEERVSAMIENEFFVALDRKLWSRISLIMIYLFLIFPDYLWIIKILSKKKILKKEKDEVKKISGNKNGNLASHRHLMKVIATIANINAYDDHQETENK